MEKKEIRAMIKAKKAALTPEEIEDYSRRATELFCAQDFYREAKAVYA